MYNEKRKEFPSPLGDPYIQIILGADFMRPPCRFRPLSEILISKSINSSANIDDDGFRPLSEILISKCTELHRKKPGRQCFRPLSEILISKFLHAHDPVSCKCFRPFSEILISK